MFTYPGSFFRLPVITSLTTEFFLQVWAVASGMTVKNLQASVIPVDEHSESPVMVKSQLSHHSQFGRWGCRIGL